MAEVPSFSRVTHRESHTKLHRGSFETGRGCLQTWQDTLDAQDILDHLDQKYYAKGGSTMLISLHASYDGLPSDRALQYASTQRERLFFDASYSDPDVWITMVIPADLTWEHVELGGANKGKRMWVLRGRSCCFFSAEEARRVFAIQNRWLTPDEWFAIGCIPDSVPMHLYQLAHGVLQGCRPYTLVPVDAASLPLDLVSFGGGDDVMGDITQRRSEMTEEEQDEEWRAACKADEEGRSIQSTLAHDLVYVVLTHSVRRQQRFGVITNCESPTDDSAVLIRSPALSGRGKVWCTPGFPHRRTHGIPP